MGREAERGQVCHSVTSRAWASTLMPKISHITSFSPEPLCRPFILHVLLISLLCFLTPLPFLEPYLQHHGKSAPRTAALGHTTISQSNQHHSGSNTTLLHHADSTALRHVSVWSLW